MNIQLGVICEDKVDICKPGHTHYWLNQSINRTFFRIINVGMVIHAYTITHILMGRMYILTLQRLAGQPAIKIKLGTLLVFPL